MVWPLEGDPNVLDSESGLFIRGLSGTICQKPYRKPARQVGNVLNRVNSQVGACGCSVRSWFFH